MEPLNIIHNEAENRFEAEHNGELAFVEYRRLGRKIAYPHTEVPDSISGRGIATSLVKHALDYARQHQLLVLPYCPFVNAYIKKHPEYADLVDPKFGK